MVLKKSLKNGFKHGPSDHQPGHKLDAHPPVVYNNNEKLALQRKLDEEDERTKLAEHKEEDEEEEEEEADDEDEEEEETGLDGGWGWMVTLGLIVVFVTTIGPNASFTIVFGDFLEATGQAGSVTTALNSLFNISYSLAGLVTSPLLKQFSMRSVGIIGALLFTIPNVLMACVRHVMEMAVIFFLQGIGLGLIFTICNVNFNAYFVKKRSMVMGVSSAIVGLGGIVYPIAMEKMMESYGFRGTAAITGALSLHCICAMSLMRPPPNWNTKSKSRPKKKNQVLLVEKVDLMDDCKKPLVKTNSLPKPREIKFLNKGEKWNSCRSLQDDSQSKNSELTAEVRVASVTDVESASSVQRGRSKSLLISSWTDWPKNRRHTALLANFTSSSLTNLRVQPGAESLNNAVLRTRPPPAAIEEDEPDSPEDDEAEVVISEKTPKLFGARSRRILDNLIDFSLLKDRGFMNMCLGISFVFTSDFTFLSFLPMMMTSRGFSKADAALAVTTGASAELVSRICLAIFTIFVDARPKMICFVATIFMTLAKVGYLYLEDTLTGTIIMVAAIGAVRSWILVPQPLVVVENMSVDQFAAAYGVFAIVSGVISVMFGPFAGLVKDWTDSFVVCQIVLLIMNALFIIPWGFEIMLEKKRNKNNKGEKK